jgi:hypothetical protein
MFENYYHKYKPAIFYAFIDMPRIEKNEMGGTCSTYQGEEAYTGFW